MAVTIDEFCMICDISSQKRKIDSVVLLIWFHQRSTNTLSISISEINQYLTNAHLPEYNRSRLASNLKSDKRVTKGANANSYKLNRTELNILNKKYGYLFDNDLEITERISLNEVPYLKSKDIDNAHIMAQLYLIIHCFENSVRNFITEILTNAYGMGWWPKIKNSEFERKVKDRKDKEHKQRWICQRGDDSPLYYLDWRDLVKIIRKSEYLFLPHINDLKFIELRFEELERVRNIIAHNGLIPDQNDIDRLILYTQDWIKQLKNNI